MRNLYLGINVCLQSSLVMTVTLWTTILHYSLDLYHFLSSDEKSSLCSTQGAADSLLPLVEDVVDTLVPITQGNLFLTSNFVG